MSDIPNIFYWTGESYLLLHSVAVSGYSFVLNWLSPNAENINNKHYIYKTNLYYIPFF